MTDLELAKDFLERWDYRRSAKDCLADLLSRVRAEGDPKKISLTRDEVALLNVLLADLACRRLERSSDLTKDGGCTTEELLAIADVMPPAREETEALILKLVDFEIRPSWKKP